MKDHPDRATGAMHLDAISLPDRRKVLAGLLALPVTGWAAEAGAQTVNRNFNLTPQQLRQRSRTPRRDSSNAARRPAPSGPRPPAIYGAMPAERFPIPAVRRGVLAEEYWRTEIEDPTGEAPGTVVVDTPAHYLYLVLPGGRAMRYGVGVGRAGFEWQGRARIAWKREWPTWTPPASMIAREPHLEKYRNGMKPGLDNPLGARALHSRKRRRHALSRTRHQRAALHWQVDVVRLHPHDQPRRRPPVQPGSHACTDPGPAGQQATGLNRLQRGAG
jgi:lipoprotein-anchoring transpeptidase ErfK/SrfK